MSNITKESRAYAPLLLRKADLAYELGCSERHVSRMRSAGKVPRPVQIGVGNKSLRWARSEIERWVRAGCPDTKTWDGMNRDT